MMDLLRATRGVVLLYAVLIVSMACRQEVPSRASAPPPAAATHARATPPVSVRPDPSPSLHGERPGYSGPLPPLPSVPFALPRPQPVVQAVFEFAARHPEVLRYVPCFCGCEHQGHGDNEDCFVSGREPDGRPRWEAHGMG